MGLVFHPGHEELHGITVVVEGRSGRTYVGRYHERTTRDVVLHDVAVHDPAATIHQREAWLRRLIRYGVPAEQRTLTLPLDEVGSLSRLVDRIAL